MTETHAMLLVESLAQALETTAFVTLMPAESREAPPGELRSAFVEFTQAGSGGLRIIAPAGFGAMLAGNMLGVGPDDPQAQAAADDALRELVNITCGNVLHARGDGAAPFTMGIPSVVAVENPRAWNEFVARRSVQVLDADGHAIAVQLSGLD